MDMLYDAEMEYRANNPKGQYNEVEYKPSPEYDDSWTWGGKRHEWGDTYGTLCSKYGPMVSLEQKHYIQKLVKEIADEFDVKTYDGFNNLVCVSTNGVSDEDAEDFIQEILDNYPELDYVETGKHWFKFALKEDDFIDHLVDDDDNTYKDIDYSGLRKYDESWIGDKARAGWKKVKDGASEIGNKVKSGAKKMAKAVGDVFKGPFRKGDHIVMRGEDGEEFKGTIKSFDLGNKTYEVLLGKPVGE